MAGWGGGARETFLKFRMLSCVGIIAVGVPGLLCEGHLL